MSFTDEEISSMIEHIKSTGVVSDILDDQDKLCLIASAIIESLNLR
ncbi:hypothetical protein phiA005_0028 [Aeromonas phage phiA005]|nr:hypothetical protein phiA005_0028 [Aeromonas phage phiA005]